jgi:hypothetical protein
MNEKKVTLLELISNEAKRRIKSEKNIHHNVCKQLMEYHQSSGFPITVLVYIAVGTNAHRPMVFEKGYQRFDKERLDKAIKYCTIFSKKYGEQYRTNAIVAHGICRYLDMNGSERKFRDLVKQSNFEMKGIKTAKEFMNKLCGDKAEYSKSGYIVKIVKK